MADIQLVIKISEEHYNAVKKGQNEEPYSREFADAIVNGIPIPDNATNGDVIKVMFPNEHDFETDFDAEWWNAKYEKAPVMYYPQVEGITPTVVKESEHIGEQE